MLASEYFHWTGKYIHKAPSRLLTTIISGGVRGVIELAILQSIMDEVDKVVEGIPIQELFDLVVGTSTGKPMLTVFNYFLTAVGGIIALGIFKRGWTVKETTEKFEDLATNAFSKRNMLKPFAALPGGKLAARLFLDFLYTSEGIEQALQSVFDSHSNLFGDVSPDQPELCKVAVIGTSAERNEAVLLTNYNREWYPNDDESKFPWLLIEWLVLIQTDNTLRREEKAENEIKVWEA